MTDPAFPVRRVYDPPAETDGRRVLIDRLWPRGVSKARAALDEWSKDLTPSTELRQWFHQDRERYPEFARRYERELHDPARTEAAQHLVDLARRHSVTLITAVKDVDHSHIPTLVHHLQQLAGTPRTSP